MAPPGWVVGGQGRRRRLPVFSMACKGLGLLLLALSLFLFSVAYTPLLHRAGGDAVAGRHDLKIALKHKVIQEAVAGTGNLLDLQPLPTEADIPDIRLWVNGNAFRHLNRQIIRYGFGLDPKKEKIPGVFLGPAGTPRAMDLSYRGTNSWHHQSWKPTLRIRLDKSSLEEGYRNHHLVAPEDPLAMRNWLSAELARQEGLLHNDEHFVRLFINNRYFGVYNRVWRLDESLLIDQDRLPGPFFRLENGTGPVFQRRPASFWKPDTWEIKGENPEKDKERLLNLLSVLAQEDSPERRLAINDLLDRDSMARWLALRCQAAEFHIDDHNLALWLDPASGKFHPVVQDINGYHWSHPREGTRTILRRINPLDRAWLHDPENLHLYLEKLRDLLSGPASTGAMEELINGTWGSLKPHFMADPFTSEMGAANGTYTRTLFPIGQLDHNKEQLLDFIRKRNALLGNQLDVAQVLWQQEGEDRVGYLFKGFSPIEIENRQSGATLKVLPRCQPDTPIPQVKLSLPGTPDRYRFRNQRTGASLHPVAAEEPLADLEFGFHPLPAPERNEIRLGPGLVHINQQQLFPPENPLFIAPGTELVFAPGASLLIRGKLTVDGTAEAPVIIRPADPQAGFGVVALVGEETAGSVVNHLHMEGGSTGSYRNLDLLGMFNVHDCPDITVKNSTFGANMAGDDGVHVIRSRARFEGCTFRDSLSDAMDWDKVDGEVVDSTFFNCGNDCLDLSMGHVRVDGFTVRGAGDKGISAGEGVTLEFQNGSIRGADMGLAAKDTALVHMYKVELDACRLGLAAYMKKWRWGAGGTIYGRDITINGSTGADLMGDKRSLMHLPWDQVRSSTLQGKLNLLPLDFAEGIQ